MATLLSDTEIVAKPLIAAQLDKFRSLLRSKCDELGTSGIGDQTTRILRLAELSSKTR